MFETIIHPNDLTETSQTAFYHSLKLGLLAHSYITKLHITEKSARSGAEKISVRPVLAKWGLLPADASRGDVKKLNILLAKIAITGTRPVLEVAEYLRENPCDLLVMALHQRDGWFQSSDAEKISQDANTATLFIPDGVKGFVDGANGNISMQRIVMPITGEPEHHAAVRRLARLIELVGLEGIKVDFLHVGTQATLPAVTNDLPLQASVETVLKPNETNVVGEILAHCEAVKPDLLVMPTAGRNGFLDALRGSTTEQVLKKVACPVLAVPAATN